MCSWGKEGAAILSVPTREYFQSSPFVPDPAEEPDTSGIASVRSSSAEYSGWSTSQPSDWDNTTGEFWNDERRRRWVQEVASPMSSGQPSEEEEELDETEAEDAFTAGTRLLGTSLARFAYDIDVCLSGMIFALSRRILPGLPYSPYRPPPNPRPPNNRNLSPLDIPSDINSPLYEGRWRLDECLRFATEIAGRRMRRRDASGLALAMEKVGWRM